MKSPTLAKVSVAVPPSSLTSVASSGSVHTNTTSPRGVPRSTSAVSETSSSTRASMSVVRITVVNAFSSGVGSPPSASVPPSRIRPAGVGIHISPGVARVGVFGGVGDRIRCRVRLDVGLDVGLHIGGAVGGDVGSRVVAG